MTEVRLRSRSNVKVIGQGHHKEVKGKGYEGQEESRSKLLGGVLSPNDLREVRQLFNYTLSGQS